MKDTNEDLLRKQDGFEDEIYIIVPTETFLLFSENSLIQRMYLTDAGYFPHARNHYRERRYGCEENIFLYCCDGSGFVQIGNKQFHLNSNDALVIPAGSPHCYYADTASPWTILWVHFKGSDTVHYPLTPCAMVHFDSQQATARMFFYFKLLFDALGEDYTENNFIYLSHILQLILSETYQRERTKKQPETQNEQVTRIIRYMSRHLNSSLSLDDIAGEFNLSRSYIHHLFRKYVPYPPMEYFVRLKMEEACKMLRTERHVVEIALSLGYKDPYYFSRVFKKVVGSSPTEYRDRLINEESSLHEFGSYTSPLLPNNTEAVKNQEVATK